MNIWEWVAALAILGIWSFLFKDNKIYRCVQGLYLGMYAGVGLANGIVLIWDMNIVPLAAGELSLVIPLVFGLLLYIRVFAPKSKYAWLSKVSMGFVIGVGTAVATYGAVNGQLIVQLSATIKSLIVRGADGGLVIGTMVNKILILLGMLSVFAYFLFSKSAEIKFVNRVSKVGRYFMMVSFGVAFGNIITNRITSFMQALQTVLAVFIK